MRLDHLLSKEESRGCITVLLSRSAWTKPADNEKNPVANAQSASPQGNRQLKDSGGDALRGDTRSHPEHEG